MSRRASLLVTAMADRAEPSLPDEKFDVLDAYPLMDEVAKSEGWDDPEMEIYNQFRDVGPIADERPAE